MEFLKANIWEIKKAGSLRTLGGLLALFHLLQFYLWWQDSNAPLNYIQQGEPMCWALFENCGWMRFLPLGLLTFFFYFYAFSMVIAAAVLLLTEFVALGYYFLLSGMIAGATLYFQDLRLSSNDGYFVFLLTFAFLMMPSKHRLMRWLIVSFFAAKGLSQTSPDWLAGAWYKQHMGVPLKLAEWFAALSVLVQMIGSVAILFRDGRYFWTGWGLMFVYQCWHLFLGDFLSSSIAMGALLYILIDEFELRKAEREYIYQSFIRPEPSFLWGGVLIGFFWLAQLTPFMYLPQQSRIKSILDIWALYPEAAQEECEQRTFAVYKGRIENVEVKAKTNRQASMNCNVYMRFLDLKSLCSQMQSKSPDFVTLSSALDIRNLRQKSSYRAFEVKDFCSKDLTFKSLNGVKWTTKPGT